MRIRGRQSYAAPPHATHAMLTDPAFLRLAAEQLGAADAEVSADAGATSVRGRVPAPSAVRTFVGDRMPVLQESTWGPAEADGSRHGTFRFCVPGAPVRLEASARLAPGGPGTTVDYEGTLTVRIPVVGAMVERAAAPAVTDSWAAQERAAARWLAR